MQTSTTKAEYPTPVSLVECTYPFLAYVNLVLWKWSIKTDCQCFHLGPILSLRMGWTLQQFVCIDCLFPQPYH